MELAERFVNLLRELGAELLPGLSDEELDAAEARHGIRFPQVIREVYRLTGGSVEAFEPQLWMLWSPVQKSPTIRRRFSTGESPLPLSYGTSREPQEVDPGHYACFMDSLVCIPVYCYYAHGDSLPHDLTMIEFEAEEGEFPIVIRPSAASPEAFIESFIKESGELFYGYFDENPVASSHGED